MWNSSRSPWHHILLKSGVVYCWSAGAGLDVCVLSIGPVFSGKWGGSIIRRPSATRAASCADARSNFAVSRYAWWSIMWLFTKLNIVFFSQLVILFLYLTFLYVSKDTGYVIKLLIYAVVLFFVVVDCRVLRSMSIIRNIVTVKRNGKALQST